MKKIVIASATVIAVLFTTNMLPIAELIKGIIAAVATFGYIGFLMFSVRSS